MGTSDNLHDILAAALVDSYKDAGMTREEAVADLAQDSSGSAAVDAKVESMLNGAWEK